MWSHGVKLTAEGCLSMNLFEYLPREIFGVFIRSMDFKQAAGCRSVARFWRDTIPREIEVDLVSTDLIFRSVQILRCISGLLRPDSYHGRIFEKSILLPTHQSVVACWNPLQIWHSSTCPTMLSSTTVASWTSQDSSASKSKDAHEYFLRVFWSTQILLLCPSISTPPWHPCLIPSRIFRISESLISVVCTLGTSFNSLDRP